ncbi:hypothetical protein CR162_18650 [Pseudoroseomonas rhizosphaerae]|uniref:Sensor protein FixL n=1 Tax=Teichococcus rhizosphaerae TaxID=1335062 RepID=A0A2C7A716_9PROT|nr:PAS domain S-box protein [Pseudoroseomonas rhizosphaerae]PHK93423.1 hypothetical protein CR162_18650 [Pseudoroseomonas rhizosphaerae]
MPLRLIFTPLSSRTFGLRLHFLTLIAVALIPALGVGGVAAWQAVTGRLHASEANLLDTSRALAIALDREFEAHKAALAALAASPSLDSADGDERALRQQAGRTALVLRSPIIAIAPDLRQRFNTSLPAGRPLPMVNSTEAAQKVFRTGKSVVGNLNRGALSGALMAAVIVPAVREGQVVAALATPILPQRLAALLATQQLEGGAFASIVDGQGVIVARSIDTAELAGLEASEWYIKAAAEHASGLTRGRTSDGQEVILAFHHLASAAGWSVAVAEPIARYNASWQRPMLALGVGGAGALALALAVALVFERRFRQPLQALTLKASEVADGKRTSLAAVPRSAVTEFEMLREAITRADHALRSRTAALAASEARLRAVVETAVDAIVVIDEKGMILSFNNAAERIFGYTAGEAVGLNVSMLMRKSDAFQHDGYLAHYQKTGEHKIIGVGREVIGQHKDGSVLPLDLAIAEWRDGEGRRFFTGIMRDISARKAEEIRRVLLAREVDHRAKNTLAVVQSVLRLTPVGEPKAFAASIEARVASLARVHSLLAQEGWSGADLRAVLERELAPYTPVSSDKEVLISLDGPAVPLAPTAVQPIAMVIHELVTNAAKHGALSQPGGRVELRWQAGRRADDDGMLRLYWTEKGGPLLVEAPTRRGFGTRVIQATLRGQLGGSVTQHWNAEGMVCEIVLPISRLTHQPSDTGGADPFQMLDSLR